MMWNTAYGYPTPANHPKPIIPAFPVMVSVSESSTTDLEVTFKPSPKYKSKIQSDGEITVKRHHHHSFRHRYYYQGDTEGGQSSSLSFPLPTFQSQSSSSPMPTPYGHTESQTRDVQLPQPIYFPGSHGSGSNINSPDQLLVHPRSIQPTRQAHPTQPSAQAPIEMPEPNQNRKPKASAKPKRPGPRPVQTPMKTSVTMPGSNPKPPSNAVVRSSSAAPGPSSSGLDRGTDRRRKRALCIGINYIGQEWFLRGCINDARSVRNFLIEYCGFPRENIVILTDSAGSPGSPTKNNILKMMRWLVKGARPGDSLFFHFSGHGGQVVDRDGDEKDGMDEVIYPVDYRKNGEIVDDDMHAIMVKHLPEGCRLTALFDSCHSGTALDLPFVYSTSGRLKSGKLTKAGAARESRADVVSWSGCKDGQTSKDTMNPDGIAVGAMSHAFIHALKRNSRLSYTNLLQDLRHELVVHNQKPQLSTSHRINPNEIFYI